ncbi:hypothetical protein GCM10022381_17460 [Leifsonia kafniensis]|uniref:Uncharacterized protein n=1 Tax=Leifsonia kafniensis TaxID=475957 RepID=A0ABP7KF45_9MICO
MRAAGRALGVVSVSIRNLPNRMRAGIPPGAAHCALAQPNGAGGPFLSLIRDLCPKGGGFVLPLVKPVETSLAVRACAQIVATRPREATI